MSDSDEKDTSPEVSDAYKEVISRFDPEDNAAFAALGRLTGEILNRGMREAWAADKTAWDIKLKGKSMFLIPTPMPRELLVAILAYTAWCEAGEPLIPKSAKNWTVLWLEENFSELDPSQVDRIATLVNSHREGGREKQSRKGAHP